VVGRHDGCSAGCGGDAGGREGEACVVNVMDTGGASGVNGVAVGGYTGGIGDGRVGDEEFTRAVKRGKEGVGGVVVPMEDVEIDIGVLWG
jgi:hypothetical protein